MDYVVIEYCLTKLWGKNIEERVRHLLLSQFRELLEEKRNVPKEWEHSKGRGYL